MRWVELASHRALPAALWTDSASLMHIMETAQKAGGELEFNQVGVRAMRP